MDHALRELAATSRLGLRHGKPLDEIAVRLNDAIHAIHARAATQLSRESPSDDSLTRRRPTICLVYQRLTTQTRRGPSNRAVALRFSELQIPALSMSLIPSSDA